MVKKTSTQWVHRTGVSTSALESWSGPDCASENWYSLKIKVLILLIRSDNRWHKLVLVKRCPETVLFSIMATNGPLHCDK